MRRLVFWLAACLLLTGCWDAAELENRGYVVSVSIDRADGMFDVSMTVPDAAAIAGKDDGEARRLLLRGQGDSLAAAMWDADGKIGKSLFFGQTKLAVFSAECLTDADMLARAADALSRGSEWSRKLLILAADGNVRAADILEAESPGEPLVGAFVSNYYKTGGAAVKLDLEGLTRALNTTGCVVLPRAAVEDKKIVLSGAAVLKDGALAGWLDEGETRGMFWLRGAGAGALVTADFDGEPVPLHVTQCARRLAFFEDAEGLVCRVAIRASGSVESLARMPNTLPDAGLLEALSGLFAEAIADEANRTFAVFRDGLAADALDFREELYKREPALYRRYAADWDSAFAGMRLEADVQVTLLQ